MKKPIIRKAVIHDIPQLCELTKMFIESSKWGFTYDDVIAIEQLYGFITQPISDVLVAEFDGVIAAGAIVVAQKDLTVETQGFLHKLFVHPDYRKTLATPHIVQACVDWFDERNCHHSFSTSTGNLSVEAICAYTKLMRKYGYEESGPTLFRVKGHG